MKLTINPQRHLKILYIALIYLVYLKPEGLVNIMPSLDSFFNLGRATFFALIVLQYLLSRFKPSKVSSLYYLLQFWIFISSIINGKSMFSVTLIRYFMVAVAVVAVTEYYLKTPEILISGLTLFYEFTVYLYLYSILGGIEINKLRETYFWGGKNELILVVLPAICIALIKLKFYRKSWLRPVMLICASVATVLMTWSATSVIAIIVVGIVYLLQINKNITQIKVFITSTILNIIIMTSTSFVNSGVYLWLTNTLLHKSSTLSGRLSIWETVLGLFRQSPLFGYGFGMTAQYTKNNSIHVASHAHNEFLQMLLVGGIVAFAIFLAINLLTVKSMDSHKNRNNSLFGCFSCTIAGIYVTYISEAYSSNWWLFMILIMAYNISAFESNKDQVNYVEQDNLIL